MKARLTIIYVYHNTPSEVIDSIQSLTVSVKKSRCTYQILVIDNNSTKKLPQAIVKNQHIKVIKNKTNIGYGAAVNQAVSHAVGEYILVTNPDVIFHPNAINELLTTMRKDKKIGVVGPQQVDKNNNQLASTSGIPILPRALIAYSFIDRLIPNNSVSKNYWLRNFSPKKQVSVPAIGGACMLFRKAAYEQVGGFDERFFLYFEESDICYCLTKIGYKIIYNPKANVMHLVGRSTKDTSFIQQHFEKSRFRFFRKYHGLLLALIGEGLLRLLQPSSMVLASIITIATFMNFYKLHELMMFYGDFGRDMLVARDMVLTGTIPLLGIPSSVVWLHQGPLSIYLIGLSFIFGKFHPVAPAMLYGFLGVISTFLVYYLGKTMFTNKVGLLASAFYVTSPLIVMNARLPYHTAPIPFFALLFFITLWKVIQGKHHLILLLFFVLGLLLQLELSNAVLIVVLIILWLYYRLPRKTKYILKAITGFSLGVLPFILHDLTNNFVQVGGLFLWILNRIRLFFGITTAGDATTTQAGSAILTIWSELVRILSPASVIITICILGLIIVTHLNNKRKFLNRNNPYGLIILLIWLLIPILGYIVHAKPGSAYFPLLFPAIALLIGSAMYRVIRMQKFTLIIFIFYVLYNGIFLIKNNYFLAIEKNAAVPAFYNYSYGLALAVRNRAIQAVITDAKGKSFAIKGGGYLSKIKTGVDNYIYLAKWRGGKVDNKVSLQYIIYENKSEVPQKAHIIFDNKFISIVKKYD